MFLTALGYPRPEHGFDGRIGIWPIVEVVVAKQTSVYRKKGEKYKEPVNMNGDVFIQMVKEKVVPAAIEKCGSWTKRVVIQIDSAGGHRVSQSVAMTN
tara:strand:+ start:2244 stop:2537 length:294 start_codon:yes stop_codon:yes gene_type:complete